MTNERYILVDALLALVRCSQATDEHREEIKNIFGMGDPEIKITHTPTEDALNAARIVRDIRNLLKTLPKDIKSLPDVGSVSSKLDMFNLTGMHPAEWFDIQGFGYIEFDGDKGFTISRGKNCSFIEYPATNQKIQNTIVDLIMRDSR